MSVASFSIEPVVLLLERRRAGATIQLVWDLVEHVHHPWSLSHLRAPMALDVMFPVHRVVAA
jgi:hypothetical protein